MWRRLRTKLLLGMLVGSGLLFGGCPFLPGGGDNGTNGMNGVAMEAM